MELITFILEKHGYRTLRAKTGRKGFKLALSEQPDFILLDIQLPDIEGTEVVQMIREEEKRGCHAGYRGDLLRHGGRPGTTPGCRLHRLYRETHRSVPYHQPDPANYRRAGVRILVAEDDENSRLLLETVLMAQGYCVDSAADGVRGAGVCTPLAP